MADALARPTPLDLARDPAAYDRGRWEAAVLSRGLDRYARLLALVLAHRAGPGGVLPAGGTHGAERLAALAGVSGRLVRISLTELETGGFLTRPDIHTWHPTRMLRPITLTMPSAAVRQEPPHPDGPA